MNRILTSILYRLPFLTKFFLQGRGFVFMLHRVLPAEKNNHYSWNKSLAITPEGLERCIHFFRKKGYDLVSMDEAYKRKNASKRQKRFIAFTMDDGYKDNLTYGLPVLQRLNVPCTIYISNCFPNNQAIYWWYFLEDYINSYKNIDLTSIGVEYRRDFSKDEKKSVYDEVRELLRKSDYETQLRFATEICEVSNLDSLNQELNLSWQEIQHLDQDPLITIGGHTHRHVSLSNQDATVAIEEVEAGTAELNRYLASPVKHFAYPYGSLDDFSKRLFPILERSGYQTAVLNHPGSIFAGSDSDYQIPRMGLSDNTKESRIMDLLSGKVHLNFNGTKKVII